MKKPNGKREGGRIRRFSRIRVDNWRNFLRIDVNLQRRVFLVGPNASGKSNFLDVFRFLHDVVSVGGGFQEAIRRRGGVSGLRSLAARRYPDIGVHVTVMDDTDTELYEYELSFTQDNLRRPIIKKEKVSRASEVLLDRPNPDDEKDRERLTQTYLEQVNVNQKYRELADFFESLRYLHIVPQLVREPDRSVGHKNDPYGGDFLEQVARTPQKTQKSRLDRIQKALRVAVPQLSEIELWRDPRGTPHLRGKYEHWRPMGAWQNEELFSDGTLRLMGLLWAVLDGNGPLLLEEPELSLHPEVVHHIPQLFARIQRKTRRQILLSTHSAEMLRDEGIGLDEVLMLIPSPEGTEVKLANTIRDVGKLLEGGLTLSDVIIPSTRPGAIEQLTLFGESLG